ncbi:MAG: hypothetical protein KTR30_33705 [Saprospiraceae bacterium]|nr:hypothetical protein [Saprospiraceae bacterium]
MFPLNRELISLAILFLIALLISTLIPHLVGGTNGHLELSFSHAAINISPLLLSPIIYIPLVYVVYLIKEWNHGYGRGRPRKTLLVFNTIIAIGLAGMLVFSKVLGFLMDSLTTSNPELELPKIVAAMAWNFPTALVIILLGLSLATVVLLNVLPLKKS